MSRTLPIAALTALALLPAPVTAAAPRWCHRLEPGETLSALAARYDVSVAALRRLNGLASDLRMRPGRLVALPALLGLKRGAFPVPAAPLTARPGHLRRENAAADREDLSRIRDRRMLRRFVRRGLLVPLRPETQTFWVSGVPRWLRVTRPWTRRFIEQLAAGAHELFGTRLKVTSLTRTERVQHRLAAWNGNAAPARGRLRSVHLTGAAVDLSTQPLAERQIFWLRHVLRRLTRQGVLHAIEELYQPHFHVLVFRRYESYARALAAPALIGGC